MHLIESFMKLGSTKLDTCTTIDALSRLQLAELILEHYLNERAKAMEHLDFVIVKSQDTKMQPSLEMAQRRREILRA